MLPLAPSRNGPDRRVIWVAEPAAMAGWVVDDWQVPFTVIEPVEELTAPGDRRAKTVPLIVMVPDDEVFLTPCPWLDDSL